MGYCYGWGGYGSSLLGGYWWIMPLLFWGLIITGIVLLVKSNKNRGNYQALNILKEEYALGRISREEFLTRKKDLQ
jgi:putative membrane protein